MYVIFERFFGRFRIVFGGRAYEVKINTSYSIESKKNIYFVKRQINVRNKSYVKPDLNKISNAVYYNKLKTEFKRFSVKEERGGFYSNLFKPPYRASIPPKYGVTLVIISRFLSSSSFANIHFEKTPFLDSGDPKTDPSTIKSKLHFLNNLR